MTGPPADAAELLERALGYTAGSLALVRPALLSRPTPCAGWDLRTLLRHTNDSLLALLEATGPGWVAPPRPAGTAAEAAADPVGMLRQRACTLLARCAADTGPDVVAVGDRLLAARTVAAAGALEIAVHGWDVARACGADRPLPPSFALRLLKVSRLLVDDVDRPVRFAPPIPVGDGDGADVRLLAFLGRDAVAKAKAA
ncbi:TIGR03086 family protein [Jiangella aurantiaca]|uniref:TIGR03086 family protein n=1 Tax=Jiangella aurantiaca TaxID=2530373 RepID=A0A4R5A539_9ACTN|nr:TIGR03086 family metal-binding protein [Jiangella aurantiaca]TDD64652.1 TIGR03086 family protein [Jiangella aurantiaca]